MIPRRSGAALVLLQLFAIPCRAEFSTLPYTTRAHAFNGWSETVQGDIRTVGTAGAVIGLGQTFIAAGENPAGLAMTLDVFDTNIASNSIHDNRIQNYDNPINISSVGAAANLYPWGFSLGYAESYLESDNYNLPSPANLSSLDVAVRQVRLGVARVFLDDRLAIGFNISLGQAERSIDADGPPAFSSAQHDYAPGMTIGALYQLPHRYLLGISYTPSQTFNSDPTQNPSMGVANFFQPVYVPYRLGIGLGWFPSKFINMGFSTYLVGATTGAALLKDDTTLVGQAATLQPRLGIAYNFLDFKELTGTVYVGSYLETSRIQDAASRYHFTCGAETKIWIVGFGAGIDVGAGYQNFLLSGAVDVGKVLEKLDLIPPARHGPRGGFLPNPFIYSDSGLPRPLVTNWSDQGGENAIEIGKSIPKKIEGTHPEEFGRDFLKALESAPNEIQKELENMKKVQQRQKKREERKKELNEPREGSN